MTQCEAIIAHMEAHSSITSIEAMRDYGIMRLASRINDLKKSGIGIRSEMITAKNRYGEDVRYASYSLIK